jgi:hypothetical protein
LSKKSYSGRSIAIGPDFYTAQRVAGGFLEPAPFNLQHDSNYDYGPLNPAEFLPSK